MRGPMKTQAKFTYMLVVAFLLAATMLVVASAAQESTTLLDKYPLKYYHITVNKTLNGTDTVLYQISLENTLNPRNIADDYPDMTYFKDITLTYSVNDDTYINYNKIKAEYKYKYKGFSLFNSSVLNDAEHLLLNEKGLRNKLNDANVFKSFKYDSDNYSTTLNENTPLVPISLDKKDVWRRLPSIPISPVCPF